MILSFSGVHRFLSNFHQCVVVLDGIKYPSVEHAYQAAKTLDLLIRNEILLCPTPAAAKRMGKLFAIRPDWDQVKLGIMEDLLKQKFEHQNLKLALLATEDQEIIEGNYWNDTFWGVCKGKGANHLGRLLMKVREELRV